MRAFGGMLLLAGLAAVLAGCPPMGTVNGGVDGPVNIPPTTDANERKLPLIVQPASQPSPDGFDPVVTQAGFYVLCDVLIVDAPAGALSKSKNLWGHLREDMLGAQTADHMARNGFRLGIGRAADFAQVSTLLSESRNAKARTGRLRFASDSAMEMVLDSQVRPRRPFVFAADGTVSGDEYPAGVTFYWVQAWHDIERIDSVNLTLVPEIRYGRVRERYYTPGMPRGEQYRDVGRMFTEVKLEVLLARGEFLVLAPRAKEGPALALGRALLCDDTNKAEPRELVVLIRPRVVRTPR